MEDLGIHVSKSRSYQLSVLHVATSKIGHAPSSIPYTTFRSESLYIPNFLFILFDSYTESSFSAMQIF